MTMPKIITPVSTVTNRFSHSSDSVSEVSAMGPTIIQFQIGANPPPRLDKALARDVPESAALSRSRLARLLSEQAITLDGQPASDPRARVVEGTEVVITLIATDPDHLVAEAIPLDIAYEDDALIVVNKAAGMVVHPAPGSPNGTLVNALMHHCPDLSGVGGSKRPGIVHRIDKDTSGLLVVAKSDPAHHGLAEQFAAHTVHRAYTALCHGTPDPADPRLRGLRGVSFEGQVMKITTQLARHKTDRQRQSVLWSGGRHAVTRATLRNSFHGAVSEVECRLETGRTHQIRVHMAYAGHGLVGDPTYGGNRKASAKALGPVAQTVMDFPRQALHARTLGFDHPITGEALQFDAPLPADMSNLLQSLTAA